MKKILSILSIVLAVVLCTSCEYVITSELTEIVDNTDYCDMITTHINSDTLDENSKTIIVYKDILIENKQYINLQLGVWKYQHEEGNIVSKDGYLYLVIVDRLVDVNIESMNVILENDINIKVLHDISDSTAYFEYIINDNDYNRLFIRLNLIANPELLNNNIKVIEYIYADNNYSLNISSKTMNDINNIYSCMFNDMDKIWSEF